MKPSHLASAVALGLVAALPRLQAQDDHGRVSLRVMSKDGPVADATVHAGRIGALTNQRGEATLLLGAGPQLIVVIKLGFRPDTVHLHVRARLDTTLAVTLEEQAADLEATVVTTTRTSLQLGAEPLRVEVLAGEEVGEKTQQRPADLTVLLREMSGVRVQPTSPSLGGANVRIQGLRGQYTQVLSDGLPLYGSQTGGLSLLQIPPLDLRQAEVIKGAATALYGPAALGGVLNLVSQLPGDERAMLANGTSRSGLDGALWVSKRVSDGWGYTLLGGAHRQNDVDVGGDGWADLPSFTRVELRPRVFLGDEQKGRSLFATIGFMGEDRLGGTVRGGRLPDGRSFEEGIDTRRGDIGLVTRLAVRDSSVVALRGSATAQWHAHRFGDARADDRHSTGFVEASYARTRAKSVLLAGVAVQHDLYRNDDLAGFDYSYTTPSLFAQGTLVPLGWLSFSASARCDAHSRYGTICSPRLSTLVRAVGDWNARLSAGTGFFAPTPFTEETEAIGLWRLRRPSGLRVERAEHGSLDLSRKRGPLQLNGTLFASVIRQPVALVELTGSAVDSLALVNAAGPTRTHGGELFVVYAGSPIVVIADYAYLRSTEIEPETGRRREVPLNARHTFGLDVAYEDPLTGTRVSVETFYTGRQALADDPYRSISRPYTTLGILLTRRIARAQLYINGENLTDIRQTKSDPLLLPAPGRGGRWTTDQWAPLEGRILNAGARVRLN
jgi:outer membrane receptor for ferrienterochelin and colicins